MARLPPVLIFGGWDAASATAMVDEVLGDPETGHAAAGRRGLGIWSDRDTTRRPLPAEAAGRRGTPWVKVAQLEWFGVQDAGEAPRRAVADWLDGPRFEAAMEAVVLSDELPGRQTSAGGALHALVGWFVP